jgi:predicted metal-dependent TIM-barrel fold hydrolase
MIIDEEKKAMVKELLDLDIYIEVIMQATGLTKEDIEEIINNTV